MSYSEEQDMSLAFRECMSEKSTHIMDFFGCRSN